MLCGGQGAVFRPRRVDFAWHLPAEYKLRHGTEKWVLRKAIENIILEYLARRPKIRMPQGTGLLFQLTDHVRHQTPNSTDARIHHSTSTNPKPRTYCTLTLPTATRSRKPDTANKTGTTHPTATSSSPEPCACREIRPRRSTGIGV